MNIARVFPCDTGWQPKDDLSFIGDPPLFHPPIDEVHVSCTFTWDIPEARRLAKAWSGIAPVKLGGVAIDGESDQPFVGGMYLKRGVTITSRGCINACEWCQVRKKNLIEFDEFPDGNIIQDNNFLACSKSHREKVYSMLKRQTGGAIFKGGLQASLITTETCEELADIKIKEIWMACDYDGAIKPLQQAIDMLVWHGIRKYKIYVYALIGKEEQRLRAIRSMGVMPFAQLYMKRSEDKTPYTDEMKKYQRIMSRPAITRNIFQKST